MMDDAAAINASAEISKSAVMRISGMIEESVVDGPGLRCTIFMQGCPHHCWGCHNPETHSFMGGYESDSESLLAVIRVNPLISGVTFSGGEPMCQARALYSLACRIRETGLHMAVYSGYTMEELLEENDPDRIRLLNVCDVLIDGRFAEEKRNLALRFRGSSNQRILDLRQSLEQGKAVPLSDPAWQEQGFAS